MFAFTTPGPPCGRRVRSVDLVIHGWLSHHGDNRALEDQFPQNDVVSTPPSTGAAYLPAVRPPGSAREERTVHPGASGLVSLVSWISPLLSEPPPGIACLRAATTGWRPALSM